MQSSVKTLIACLAILALISCKRYNIRPECEIISPANGTEYTIGELIIVKAAASDEDGNVIEVRFELDGDVIGSDADDPYQVSWNTSGIEPGNYSIRAIAEDNLGDTASERIILILQAAGNPPEALFSASSTMIESGMPVQFTDQSLYAPDSWFWEFGDDSTSTLQNPSHTYNTAGSYDVKLTVSNELGMDALLKSAYIVVNENTGSGNTDTLVDLRDGGREYQAVKIGNQWWMAENLAYLPEVFPESEGSDSLPRYYVYEYGAYSTTEAKETENYKLYGVLYNKPAALEACPEGWHLPSDAEWDTLQNYLVAQGYNFDDSYYDNRLAKAMSGSTGWYPSNILGAPGNSDYPDKRNSSGFSAMPGGARSFYNYFYDKGEAANWWSADEGWARTINYNGNSLIRYGRSTDFGLSVRCVKDQ